MGKFHLWSWAEATRVCMCKAKNGIDHPLANTSSGSFVLFGKLFAHFWLISNFVFLHLPFLLCSCFSTPPCWSRVYVDTQFISNRSIWCELSRPVFIPSSPSLPSKWGLPRVLPLKSLELSSLNYHICFPCCSHFFFFYLSPYILLCWPLFLTLDQCSKSAVNSQVLT